MLVLACAITEYMANRNVQVKEPGKTPATAIGLQIDIRILERLDGQSVMRIDARMEGDPAAPGAKEGDIIPAPVKKALDALIQSVLDNRGTMLGL